MPDRFLLFPLQPERHHLTDITPAMSSRTDHTVNREPDADGFRRGLKLAFWTLFSLAVALGAVVVLAKFNGGI